MAKYEFTDGELAQKSSKPSPVFCKNCGSQIFQDQFDNGGPKWIHGHSLMFSCGTADGIQTIAEPAE